MFWVAWYPARVFSIVNLLVDILYAFIDPRIKAQYKGRMGWLKNE